MNPLVSPEWLQSRLNDPNIVLVDASLPPIGEGTVSDAYNRYLAQHIFGAVFFDVEALSDKTTSLPHMLPTPDSFSREMSALGIRDSSTLIIYEQEGVFSAPRVWWTFRIFGIKDVRILDGGLTGWLKKGMPTVSGLIVRKPAEFKALSPKPNDVIDFKRLQIALSAREQIVDARSAGRFNGTSPEPRAGLSSGHMPGAINIPFSELLDGGRMKSSEQLLEIFNAKGLDLEKPITTTCGSGITAAVVVFALEIAGAKQVSLYDGSWTEYAQHANVVIEKPN